jgi:hypothetical protein
VQTPQQAIDASLQPSELIADAVKRSSRAHVFHFYTLLCEIASVPRKAPNAWITADRLVASGEPAAGKEERAAATEAQVVHHGGRPTQAVTSGASSSLGHIVSLDARVLARECLKEVGRELGVPR